MSERKVLNKYYPPDFDPSKIPRMKLPRNRQYTVRLMAPFNMRCKTCGEYIYKGKKFNARKEDVENETYLGIRIYRFYIKCTRCLQEISFKTDPKNTDYEIEAGATRNFMALKLAEEQAIREENELKEEEANNPMKLLENRTEQSKNEIELLESLEELKDLNRRHLNVDYDVMLQQYDTKETAREREERLQKLDEDYIKTVRFASANKQRIVVEEEIIETDEPEKNEDSNKTKKNVTENDKSSLVKRQTPVWKSQSIGLSAQKLSLSNLVKVKRLNDNSQNDTVNKKLKTNNQINQGRIDEDLQKTDNGKLESGTASNINNKPSVNSLSLLTAYSDSDEENSN